MEDELTCVVCSELYAAGTREPVVLPSCGHTFCRQCLYGVVESQGALACPTCRSPHPGTPVQHLPTVFALLNISENFKRSERGGCREHRSPLEFWCRGCQKPLCGHCLLEAHVREGHSVDRATVFVEERKKEIHTRSAQLVQNIRTRTDSVISGILEFIGLIVRGAEESRVLSSSAQTAEKILKDMTGIHSIESMLMSLTLVESLQAEVNKFSASSAPSKEGPPERGDRRTRCDSCCQLETSSSVFRQVSVSEAEWQETQIEETEQIALQDGQEGQNATLEFSESSNPGTKTNPEEVREVRRSSSVCEDEAPDGSQSTRVGVPKTPWPLRCCVMSSDHRTGELRWDHGRLHLYALRNHLDDGHFMVQMSLLQSLMSREKPQVFLDLGMEGASLGRVYIRLNGRLRRAQHFLALCLGSLGPSYRASKFHGVAKPGAPGETLAGGKYLTPEGTSVQGLMQGLEWGGEYISEKVEGLVVGARGGEPELDAFFHICTREHKGKKFACAFGEVVEGMDVVHAAVKHVRVREVTIVDVGVVIPTSQE
nr:uncharacterized protein LOC123755847 [Procambarus clarkii]